jgi:hypothetical protein
MSMRTHLRSLDRLTTLTTSPLRSEPTAALWVVGRPYRSAFCVCTVIVGLSSRYCDFDTHASGRTPRRGASGASPPSSSPPGAFTFLSCESSTQPSRPPISMRTHFPSGAKPSTLTFLPADTRSIDFDDADGFSRTTNDTRASGSAAHATAVIARRSSHANVERTTSTRIRKVCLR